MATHAAFNELTGASTVAAAFPEQIKGKTILIVGVSPNSLGESKAAALAAHSPALLILASRTPSNIDEVARKLPCPTATVQVDLSSPPSVRAAAIQIHTLTRQIDILINNAAIVHPSYILTPSGHELQLATTFLGPFLLTNLLLPLLLTSSTSSSSSTPGSTRIINITSAGHRLNPVRYSDPHFTQPATSLPASEQPPPTTPAVFLPKGDATYAPFLAYAQSKTANILFSVALNKRLLQRSSTTQQNGIDGVIGTGGMGGGIASFAAHPGSIWTELSRNLDAEMQAVIKTTGTHWKDLDAGGATGVVAALDPALVDFSDDGNPGARAVKGVYLADCQVDGTAAAFAVDEENAERLWALAEREVGETFDVPALVARHAGRVGKGKGMDVGVGEVSGGGGGEKGQRVRVGAREVKV